MTERFTAALVGPPFGLTGRVKIESASGESGHLLRLTRVMLRQGGREREYQIEAMFTAPLSVKFAGIDSPEAAKTLRGAELLVSRAEAAPLLEGEFYIEDLKGLKVYADNAVVGTITGVIEGGGGFLAELLLDSGAKRLVPFRDEFFGPVNPASGRAELLCRWILE